MGWNALGQHAPLESLGDVALRLVASRAVEREGALAGDRLEERPVDWSEAAGLPPAEDGEADEAGCPQRQVRERSHAARLATLTRAREVGGKPLDALVVRRTPPAKSPRAGPVHRERHATLLDQVVRNALPRDGIHVPRLRVDDAQGGRIDTDGRDDLLDEDRRDVGGRQRSGEAGREGLQTLRATAGDAFLLVAAAAVERDGALLEDRAGDGENPRVERGRRAINEAHGAERSRTGLERKAVRRLLVRRERGRLHLAVALEDLRPRPERQRLARRDDVRLG